jgi:hypothetical protein
MPVGDVGALASPSRRQTFILMHPVHRSVLGIDHSCSQNRARPNQTLLHAITAAILLTAFTATADSERYVTATLSGGQFSQQWAAQAAQISYTGESFQIHLPLLFVYL